MVIVRASAHCRAKFSDAAESLALAKRHKGNVFILLGDGSRAPSLGVVFHIGELEAHHGDGLPTAVVPGDSRDEKRLVRFLEEFLIHLTGLETLFTSLGPTLKNPSPPNSSNYTVTHSNKHNIKSRNRNGAPCSPFGCLEAPCHHFRHNKITCRAGNAANQCIRPRRK